MSRRDRWFSAGAASAVAVAMDIRAHGVEAGEVIRCDTGSEDEDNDRFAADCEKWWRAPITTIRSDEYTSTWDVWERRKFMAGIHGAVCTGELKLAPRLAFQRPGDIHVFGYTADASDVARATRLRENYPELTIVTPLIERGITKAACRGLLKAVGIAEPRTYAMGFPNANCLKSGCCKSTSPRYWSLHRRHFPDGFAQTAARARALGVRLARINGERVYIDDIPADYPTTEATAPTCDFLCHLASEDLAA